MSLTCVLWILIEHYHFIWSTINLFDSEIIIRQRMLGVLMNTADHLAQDNQGILKAECGIPSEMHFYPEEFDFGIWKVLE